jgi:hypothetical protein
MPQMPAFHLVEPGCRGITMINIGTGPSNARRVATPSRRRLEFSDTELPLKVNLRWCDGPMLRG